MKKKKQIKLKNVEIYTRTVWKNEFFLFQIILVLSD